METGSGLLESVVDLGNSPVAAPTLLVELPPWHRVFRRNLLDLLRPQAQPPLRLASKPATFWPDVFVPSHLPWRRFLESSLYHGIAFLMLWGASVIWFRRPQIAMHPVFTHEDVIYYQASELLPPLDTGGAHPKQSVKGDPAYAPQPIISVPREADNRRQTIVTPPKVKLDHDVPLPNVVAWQRTLPAAPITATERATLSKTPTLDAPVVAPPPDVKLASSRNAIRSLQPAVVEPSPVMDSTTRRPGDLNIAPAQVVAPAPQLAVEAQRVPLARNGLGSAAAVVPPPPSVSGSGTATSGSRLIALGIHPSVGSAPVDPPTGNRRGSFAATPQGKAGAAGTPDIVGEGRNSGAGNGKASSTDVPTGLYVGAGADPKTSAVGGNGQGNGNGGNGSGSRGPSKDSVLMAKATPPRVSSTSRPTETASSNGESELEKKVFGDRKFYAMTVNIPNLNSAGGSWVIHFAELSQDNKDKADLTAPTATAMSDPAYPLELMKQHVQGTVTLYAVIGSDGSVSNVRVLNSVDDRLDQYASEALARWHFRPASKNGNPVALEAVVKIPFRPSRMRSNF